MRIHTIHRGGRIALVALAGGLLLASNATPAAAQGSQPAFATRAEIEQALANTLANVGKAGRDEAETQREAAHLRERLTNGDFYPGDQIVVQVRGDSTLSGTFTLREGRVLRFESIDPLSLQGVLRSELLATLERHIRRYVREPVVSAQILMRVAVTGHVSRPGYYAVDPNSMLSDAIMAAGGPTPSGDLTLVGVKREGWPIMDEKAVQSAMVRGESLDKLNLRPGDEIAVGERRRSFSSRALPIAATLSAIAVSVMFLVRGS